MSDQEIRCKAAECAARLYAAGKIAKEQIEMTAEYFFRYIKEGKS